MQKKLIVILEDDLSRIEVMKSWLADRLYMYDHYINDQPENINRLIEADIDRMLAVSLDHDLNEVDLPPGRKDATGMNVADFLIEQPVRFPVLIHSSNRTASEQMYRQFKQHHWPVARVTPFNDTEWIGSEWFPALRKLIRQSTVAPVPATPCDHD